MLSSRHSKCFVHYPANDIIQQQSPCKDCQCDVTHCDCAIDTASICDRLLATTLLRTLRLSDNSLKCVYWAHRLMVENDAIGQTILTLVRIRRVSNVHWTAAVCRPALTTQTGWLCTCAQFITLDSPLRPSLFSTNSVRLVLRLQLLCGGTVMARRTGSCWTGCRRTRWWPSFIVWRGLRNSMEHLSLEPVNCRTLVRCSSA